MQRCWRWHETLRKATPRLNGRKAVPRRYRYRFASTDCSISRIDSRPYPKCIGCWANAIGLFSTFGVGHAVFAEVLQRFVNGYAAASRPALFKFSCRRK